MKKKLVKIGTLVIMLMATFGCEKKESPLLDAKAEKFAVVIEMQDLKGNLEKSIIVGTKAELEASLMGEKPGVFKKVAKRANILVPTTGTVGPVGPVGPGPHPYEACWDEIMAIRDAHIAEWVALANQHCQPVWRCVGCPETGGGLVMEFHIYPTSPKCNFLVADKLEERFNLIPFGIGEEDYESEALLEFIKKAK